MSARVCVPTARGPEAEAEAGARVFGAGLCLAEARLEVWAGVRVAGGAVNLGSSLDGVRGEVGIVPHPHHQASTQTHRMTSHPTPELQTSHPTPELQTSCLSLEGGVPIPTPPRCRSRRRRGSASLQSRQPPSPPPGSPRAPAASGYAISEVEPCPEPRSRV